MTSRTLAHHGLGHSLAHLELDHLAGGDHHGLPCSGVASLARSRYTHLEDSKVSQFEPAILDKGPEHLIQSMLDHSLSLDSSDAAPLRNPLRHISLGIHAFPFVVMLDSTLYYRHVKKRNLQKTKLFLSRLPTSTYVAAGGAFLI